MPGVVSSIREWFRTYKIPDGKPENVFALNDECMGAEYAMQVVEETHHAWLRLVSGEYDRQAEAAPESSLKRANLSYPKLSHEDLTKLVEEGA